MNDIGVMLNKMRKIFAVLLAIACIAAVNNGTLFSTALAQEVNAPYIKNGTYERSFSVTTEEGIVNGKEQIVVCVYYDVLAFCVYREFTEDEYSNLQLAYESKMITIDPQISYDINAIYSLDNEMFSCETWAAGDYIDVRVKSVFGNDDFLYSSSGRMYYTEIPATIVPEATPTPTPTPLIKNESLRAIEMNMCDYTAAPVTKAPPTPTPSATQHSTYSGGSYTADDDYDWSDDYDDYDDWYEGDYDDFEEWYEDFME